MLAACSFISRGNATPTPCRQRVSLISIDQFAIEDLSLIQLDVEGFERQILEGHLKRLPATSP